jgi:macrolide-specific efflux system membrane fusion protein
VRVPALRDGVLAEVVKVGTKVKKGDGLARLDDRLAVLEREIKAAKLVSARAELLASVKTCEEAKKRYETSMELARRNAISQEEVRGAALTLHRYESEVASRKEGVTVAELECKQAALLLELYEVRAPSDGVVKKVVRRNGEAVKALETVILLEAAD